MSVLPASFVSLPALRATGCLALLALLAATAPAQQTAAPVPPAIPTTLTEGPLPESPSQLRPVVETADPIAPFPDTRVSGIVQDATGAIVPGALITVVSGTTPVEQAVQSTDDGSFTLHHVAPGPYTLSVSSPGLLRWSTSGTLAEGTTLNLSEIALPLGAATADVTVHATTQEIAAAEISLAEKQRVLGVIPNFYASYVPDAAPLTKHQKFSLAWRFSVDPAAFFMAGIISGTEQSQNGFSGYGQGMGGYSKRFAATYADGFSSTMLGQAIFPALFHQDPRYFVKGTGSVRSRFLYAVANTVMCKGDNRDWQVNYSNILGNLASASLSNLYYPAGSRNGATLTLQNSLVTTASGVVGNMFQEFVLRRMTPHVPDYASLRK